MKNSIEISNKGIKLSYKRFMSDTAIGLSIVAIIFLLFNDSNAFTFLKNATLADKVFLYTLVFILATPLGLLVNISSWIIFGFFQYYLSKDIILKCDNLTFIGKFIFSSTNEKYQVSTMKKVFLLDNSNFYRIIKKIETFLDIFMQDSISYKENLIGMRIFYRNVSFILFIIGISMIYKAFDFQIIILVFSFSFFFLITNSIVNVYYIFYHLIRFYHLFLADDFDNQKSEIKVIKEAEIDLFINKFLNYYYTKQLNG